MRRNVCVVGWYYDPAWLAALAAVPDATVTVMAHRPAPGPVRGVTIIPRENIGLEWGAYSHYLDGEWSEGPTLFVHDDVAGEPAAVDALFRTVADRTLDFAFVFSSDAERRRNNGHHGRAWIASDRFLATLRARGGIWFDATNHGTTDGRTRNRGSHHFFWDVLRLGEEGHGFRYGCLVTSDLDLGFRGQMGAAGRAAAETLRQEEECHGAMAHHAAHVAVRPPDQGGRVPAA